MCSREALLAVGLHDSNPVPLMFQTGYLTIASFDEDEGLYELRFPNREVEKGFYQQLLMVYVPDTTNPFSPFDFTLFKTDLTSGRPEDFMKRLDTLLKSLPYEDHNESVYRAVTFLISVLSGTPTYAEMHSYKGRSDLEVVTKKYIYIFEFKYNESVAVAMSQILTRDYAGRYAIDSRKVYLIGANFVENRAERGLEYEVKELK